MPRRQMTFNTDFEPILTVSGKEVSQAVTKQETRSLNILDPGVIKKRDMQTHKALPWSALNMMPKLWKFDLTGWLKLCFFRAAVEFILLYGYATWSALNMMPKL